MRTTLGWMLLMIVGCGGPREVVDAAQICFADPSVEDQVQLAADAPLVLTAVATAGCHTDELQVSCDVAVDGDRIEVSAYTTWVRTEPLAMGCESILVTATATCETEALPAGTYEVVYAGASTQVEIPGAAPGCLDAPSE